MRTAPATAATAAAADQPAAEGGAARLLVADDDDNVRHAVVAVLTRNGYRVLEAVNGAEAYRIILEQQPSLLVLDVEMPELGGLALLQRLRDSGRSLPVLILSNRADIADRVKGLTVGADDYLGKPFDYEELCLRVAALLRRAQVAHGPQVARITLGDTVVDLARMTATGASGQIALTRTECALLELLARHSGKPVTLQQIFDVVWGYTRIPSTRTLDTHVWRLRKKIGDIGDTPRWLRNVPGIGYQLDPTATAAPP